MVTSYTVAELERETGVDRRTISYYVQVGLLPKVGRRGPRTRYPKLARDRLLFIRRVREAEEAGDVEAVSLRRIKRLFGRLSRAQVASVADGDIAVTPDLVGGSEIVGPEAPPSPVYPRSAPTRSPISAFSSGDKLKAFDEDPFPIAYGPAASDDPPERRKADVVRPLMRRDVDEARGVEDALRALVRLAEARNRSRDRPSNTWTRIEISPHVAISARGLAEDDPALETVRRALEGLLSRRRR